MSNERPEAASGDTARQTDDEPGAVDGGGVIVTKGHHPLPADDRARHDVLPEGIENVRDKGDDSAPGKDGDAPAPRTYAEPDGSPYPA